MSEGCLFKVLFAGSTYSEAVDLVAKKYMLDSLTEQSLQYISALLNDSMCARSSCDMRESACVCEAEVSNDD